MSLLWPSHEDRLAELIERAQRGDRAAFRSLYIELYGPVSAYIGRRVARPEDVEDLVARVFHRLLERLDDFDASRGTAPMFALMMAKTAVIDHLRAAKAAASLDEIEGTLADEAGTPLDALVHEEELRDLRALVHEMPADMREMFALRYGDGLRYGQIAELLGASAAAVKQRFSRALRDLKARLGEPGRGPRSGGARRATADRTATEAETAEARSKGGVVDVPIEG